jgi:DNA-binding GntR family transcriptional regulator
MAGRNGWPAGRGNVPRPSGRLVECILSLSTAVQRSGVREVAAAGGGATAKDPMEVVDGTADTAGLVSIRPQMLHAAIVEQLQRMIVEGALAPGTRLNERMLCAQLGVSRTPLREAFRVLAAQGLVALLPNRGAVVVRLTTKDIAETFEVISGLEAMSGELACARITPAEVDAIRALHQEMLACHARLDLPGYYRRNQRIHDAINLAARNDVLRDTYTTVNSRLHALRFRSNFDREKWDAAVLQHSEMIVALEARDGPRLAAVLRAHVQAKCAAVLALEAADDAAQA